MTLVTNCALLIGERNLTNRIIAYIFILISVRNSSMVSISSNENISSSWGSHIRHII